MHDPTAIFRFEEHDVYIPMTVLEELDAGKKGLSESARNVRQVSRFLDELMHGATKKQIDRGLALPTAVPINHGKRPPGGRLFFQTQLLESVLPDSLPGHGADNAILANTLALQQKFPHRPRHPGVERHQSAHQGGDSRRAGRGLFERQDHRRCGPAGQRRAAAAAEFLGKARQGHGVLAAAEPHLSIECAVRWCANGRPINSSTIPARTASKPSCASSRASRRFSSSRSTTAPSATTCGA